MSLRLEWTLLFALGCALAIPLWRVEFLPLTDLPQHLAILADLRRYDTSDAVQAAYTRSFFPSSNVLFHVLVLAFGRDVPLETAVRVVLTAGFVAYTAVAGLAVRAHGARPLAAALALPLVLSYPFTSGYLNYWLAWPPALAAWLLLDRRGLGAATGAAALAVVALLAHVQVWGLFVGAPVVFAWRAAPGERLRAALRVGAALAPSLALAALYATAGASDGGVGDWGLHARWAPVDELIPRFWTWQTVVTESEPADYVSVALWAGGFGLAVYDAVRERRATALLMVGLACLVASFVLPEHLTNQYYVASRMLAPASMILSLALVGPRRAVAWLGVGAVLLHLVAVDHAWRCADAAARGLREVVAAADDDGRMLGIAADRRVPHLRNLAFLHSASFHTVDNGGESAFSFAIFESSPLRWRDPGARVHLRPGKELRPICAFLSGKLPVYRYVLARASGRACPVGTMIGPRGSLRAAEGDWQLYEMRDAMPRADAPPECGC